MRGAVACELVALRGDLADEVGIALGGHAEHEERRPAPELVEQREDRLRLPLERRALPVPVRPPQAAMDELVPVLEVEAEQELGHGRTLRSPRVRQHAPIILVAGLLVATATAFAVTERLKLEDSPVLGTKIRSLVSPVCACPPKRKEVSIRFRLRREQDIRLDIVDVNGTIVRRALASGVFPARSNVFSWDGRDNQGNVVPDGVYRVDLTLRDESRRFELPNEIRVDSTPPKIEDVKISHATFSPDGDRRADRVDVAYRFSEPAYAILYVDGKRLPGRSFTRKPSGTIQWYGRGAKRGEHRLAVVAQDLAGNVAASTREYTVRIRFVELPKSRYVVRGRTLRVRVSTDVQTVHWQLAGRRGTVHKHVFVIPVPRPSGRYRLAVSANGHTTRATVVVRHASR
jgi:flagellar hook capping protein FlgD